MMRPHLSEKNRDTIAWIVLIGVVVFSVIRTQAINDNVSDTQAGMQKQQNCTIAFLASTVKALNDRTDLSGELNQADADRIKSQGRLIGFLVRVNGQRNVEPSSALEAQYNRVLNDYFSKLQAYLALLAKQGQAQDNSPYPTAESYIDCINRSDEGSAPSTSVP